MTKILPLLMLLALTACGAPFTSSDLTTGLGEAGEAPLGAAGAPSSAGAATTSEAGSADLASAGAPSAAGAGEDPAAGAAGTATSGGGSGGDPVLDMAGATSVGGAATAAACAARGWDSGTQYPIGWAVTGSCGLPDDGPKACQKGKKYLWTCASEDCGVIVPGGRNWGAAWSLGELCQ